MLCCSTAPENNARNDINVLRSALTCLSVKVRQRAKTMGSRYGEEFQNARPAGKRACARQQGWCKNRRTQASAKRSNMVTNETPAAANSVRPSPPFHVPKTCPSCLCLSVCPVSKE